MLRQVRSGSALDMVVFFTVWLSAAEDIGAAALLRRQQKQLSVVFTGPYPTWKPELFLKSATDLVIRGEPEQAFREIIDRGAGASVDWQGIPGVSCRDADVIRHGAGQAIADVERLPTPDRTLLRGTYIFNRLSAYPATVLCASRGCSFRCSFCAPHALDQAAEIECLRQGGPKPPLRLRSAAQVIAEFQEIARLGYRGVEIIDNQFVWDAERTMVICEAIESLRLRWTCYARADYVQDPKLLAGMKAAGCALIFIGTDSFDQRILDDTKKDIRLADNYRAVRLVRESGIEPEISLIFGASPLETPATIRHSIREARTCRTDFVHYSIAAPLPNTALYRMAKENGYLRASEFAPLDNVRAGVLELPQVSGQFLQNMVRRCYREQYLSPRFIVKMMSSAHGYRLLAHYVKTMVRLLKYIGGIS